MDATYRTTQYGLPMFVMTVVDNHGHGQPIALFFVQEETGDSIAEVLQIFKETNPGFEPACCMIDKSDMEMNGIKAVYPNTCVLICDFHRYVIGLESLMVCLYEATRPPHNLMQATSLVEMDCEGRQQHPHRSAEALVSSPWQTSQSSDNLTV
jgi:hypothetical protein